MNHLAAFEEKAVALLDAYTFGTPEALERHYALTWHRRAWPAMREYVQLDLGKRPANPGDDVPLTIDDARLHVALDHGFATWHALEAEVGTWPAHSVMAHSPVRVRAGNGDDAPLVIETRNWTDALAALADHPGAVLDGGGQVTDRVLEQISQFESLEQLHLGNCKALTDDGIAHLARLPRLRVLDLSQTGVTDRGLAVLRELKQLERLQLVFTRVSDAGLANLTHCDALERLELLWTNTGDGAIRALAGKPRFREFISGNLVGNDGLAALRDIPAYRDGLADDAARVAAERAPNELVLRGTFTDDSLAHFRHLNGLAQLGFHDCSISERGIAHVAAMPNLLRLSCDATDAWMPAIAAMPALRALDAQDTSAGDDGFIALAASRTIEKLWLRRCHNLRDRGFRALATMPALHTFSGSCLNVSDDAISLLPEFPALRDLMPMDVPDAGYRHIGKCTALDVLTLMYCRNTTDAATEHLTNLKLRTYFNSYTTITDRTPEILSAMDSLERVTFSACNELTNTGIAMLARLPNLRKLDASGLKLSPEVAKQFPARVRVRVTS